MHGNFDRKAHRALLLSLSFFLLTVMLLLLIFLLSSPLAIGRILTVDDDYDGDDDGDMADFPAIGDALDEAEDGDIIRVHSGTYYETLTINRSIALIGNGSGETIIDGKFHGTIVTIAADRVNISGFHIRNSGETWPFAGIAIDSNRPCSDLNITKNIISSTHYGLHISGSRDSVIEGNTCLDNTVYGIYLHDVTNSVVSNNSCTGNEFGIRLWLSTGNVLENNTCSRNDDGISLLDARNNTLLGNSCLHNSNRGILVETSENFLHYSNGTMVRNNICNENGDGIRGIRSGYNDYLENECNFNRQSGIVIDSGSYSEIRNNTCDSNANGTGISLISARFIEIADNECSTNKKGISALSSESVWVWNSVCSENRRHGIVVDYSKNFFILENECAGNGRSGIASTDSNFLEIGNNSCMMNSQFGIELHYGNDQLIESNSLFNNTNGGIYLLSCVGNRVLKNNCSYGTYGILMRFWDEDEFTRNSHILAGNEFEGNGWDIEVDLARSDQDTGGTSSLAEIFGSEFVYCCLPLIVTVLLILYVVDRARSKSRKKGVSSYTGSSPDTSPMIGSPPHPSPTSSSTPSPTSFPPPTSSPTPLPSTGPEYDSPTSPQSPLFTGSTPPPNEITEAYYEETVPVEEDKEEIVPGTIHEHGVGPADGGMGNDTHDKDMADGISVEWQKISVDDIEERGQDDDEEEEEEEGPGLDTLADDIPYDGTPEELTQLDKPIERVHSWHRISTDVEVRKGKDRK